MTPHQALSIFLGALFVLGACMFGMSLAGCPLQNPVPCQGEPYPAPCLARDAGGER